MIPIIAAFLAAVGTGQPGATKVNPTDGLAYVGFRGTSTQLASAAPAPNGPLAILRERLLRGFERAFHFAAIFIEPRLAVRLEAHHQHRLRVRGAQQAPAVIE